MGCFSRNTTSLAPRDRDSKPNAPDPEKASSASLNAKNAQLWAGDALAWLQQNPQPFDLVFLDPPFGKDLLQPSIDSLQLLPGAWVYVEHETGLALTLPAGWEEYRSKTTKEFCFRLFQVTETEG